MASTPSYYTVEQLRSSLGSKWRWRVCGYDAAGKEIYSTVHASEISKDTECRAWERRGATFREVE